MANGGEKRSKRTANEKGKQDEIFQKRMTRAPFVSFDGSLDFGRNFAYSGPIAFKLCNAIDMSNHSVLGGCYKLMSSLKSHTNWCRGRIINYA